MAAVIGREIDCALAVMDVSRSSAPGGERGGAFRVGVSHGTHAHRLKKPFRHAGIDDRALGSGHTARSLGLIAASLATELIRGAAQVRRTRARLARRVWCASRRRPRRWKYAAAPNAIAS